MLYPQNYADQLRLLHERSLASVHTGCAAAEAVLPGGAAWRCLLAPVVGLHVRAPLFLLSSRADAWQLRNELGYTADAVRVNDHAGVTDGDHLALLHAGAATGRGHGAFLHSCSAHLGQWRLDIGGVDMRTAVGLWVASRLASSSSAHSSYPVTAKVATVDFGGGGYKDFPFFWVQNRTYPCLNCCEGHKQPQTTPSLARGQAIAYQLPESVDAE